MQSSESVKNLFLAKLQCQKELKTVKKDKENPQTRSKYASWDAILETLIPVLNKNGLVLTPIPGSSEERISIKVRLDHPDSGEWCEFEEYSFPKDSNSKNTRASQVQNEGGILTYAKRYAVTALFNIAADEDTDGNLYRQQVQNQNQYQQKKVTQDTVSNTLNTKKKLYSSFLNKICEKMNLDKEAAKKLITDKAGDLSNLNELDKYTAVCVSAQKILEGK